MNEKVSVVVPVYNAEPYVEACLESILKQSYENIEVIVIDDGSKDKSYLCCKEYECDSRVKIYQQENHGVSFTRNRGIELSTGEYIMFVDSDDVIDQEMIYKLVEGIQDNDFAFCGMKKIYFNDKTECVFNCDTRLMSSCELMENLEYYMSLNLLQGPCGKLFSTSLVKKNALLFPVDMSYGEDSVFVYSYLRYIDNCKVVGDVFYSYIIRGNESLCSRFREDKLEIHLYIIDLLKEVYVRNKITSFQDVKSRLILKSYISYFDEAIDMNIEKGRILSIIRLSNSNKDILECSKRNCRKSIQSKLISILICLNLIHFEYLFFYLKKCKRRFKYRRLI